MLKTWFILLPNLDLIDSQQLWHELFFRDRMNPLAGLKMLFYFGWLYPGIFQGGFDLTEKGCQLGGFYGIGKLLLETLKNLSPNLCGLLAPA